jgi:hypothetical protein
MQLHIDRQADRTRQRGWPVHELETGHEAMVTAPNRRPTATSSCPTGEDEYMLAVALFTRAECQA